MAEINNTQTTEAIPVVSIPIDSVPSAHLAVKEFDLSRGVSDKGRDKIVDIMKCDFLAFLIIVYQNKCHFCNTEAKLNKVAMLQNESFVFGDLTLIDLILTLNQT